MRKLLFPPIVPNSLPAFDKSQKLRYYFKPSIANSMSEIKHLQMSIVRLDTNGSVLTDTNRYPYDVLFKESSEIKEDTSKGFWYVDVAASIFPDSDTAYKVQIRLGETDINGMTTQQLGNVMKDYDKMSEWSIVTIVMPITVPDFGIQSFEIDVENRVVSTGHVFNGYYEAKDSNRAETLSSYRFNLYSGDASKDSKTWKLLSTSGEKYIGVTDRINMSYTFPYELKENEKFIVALTIKSKNLYTSTKVYRIYSAAYPILEMFNSIDVVPNYEDAQMDITVRAKQILMKPESGATVTYYKDTKEPNVSQYPNLKATHAKIDGSIISNNDISLTTKDGIWICQFKAMFPKYRKSLAEIVATPNIEISQANQTGDNGLITKIKVGCMRINLAYPTTDNPSPTAEWEYRFVVRKEVVVNSNGKEEVILAQNKVIRHSGLINSKQEYYFYIKEDSGSLYVDVKKTYLSTDLDTAEVSEEI